MGVWPRAGRRRPAVRRSLADTLTRCLGLLPWAALAVGTPLAAVNLNKGSVPDSIGTPTMSVIFAALVARLLVGAVLDAERRVARLSLAAALVLWCVAALEVTTAPVGTPLAHFPAPGEWPGLASVLALATYLVVDVASRARSSVPDWLEAVVASGSAVCAVALLVVTPVAEDFARQGVPLLVALIYPTSDVLLLAIVVGQVVLRKRAAYTESAILLGGLILLTAADVSGSAVNITKGAYTYSLLGDLAWCLGFILVAESAACPRREPSAARAGSTARGWVTVASAAVALGALTFQPPGTARVYVVVPAFVTFLAAGARLVIALREARGAAEAYRLSRTDDLTGLPNRRAVIAELADRMAGRDPLTVMLIDLDGFKEINDSLGHGSGDALLQIIARRLRYALPDDVIAARLGSDEFALVLGEADSIVLSEIADDMRRLIRRPIHLDGLEVSVEASVGIAVRTEEIATKGDLLRCADVAMVQAKQAGAGTLLYDAAQDEFSRSRLALAEELRNGLEKGQIVVWYQPQVDADSGEVCSVEALVRWKHPTQGLLSPYAFLPVARRAGLMPRLTEVVLARAIKDLAQWLLRGIDLSVAVNVAPPELLGGTVLPELGALLAREQVPANRLVVEVTEDSFLADPDHARRIIRDLRGQGVQVSIDDYGTGFSSLAYLRDLPLQELKIDQSFVKDILHDRRSWMIVNTTNQLAHGLGLRTVAEGVEDDELRAELVAIGVDVLQGYHFARPMPADHLVEWLLGRRKAQIHAGSA